jgi:hypothetical protein
MDIQLEVHTMSNHKSITTDTKHIMDDGTRMSAIPTWGIVLIVALITIAGVLS